MTAPVPLDLTAFRAAVDASFVPLEVTSASPDTFRGQLDSRTVAGVSFSTVRAEAHTVRRTPELIARSPRAYFKITLQNEGTSELSQHGRRITLTPGDLAIYDTSQPYELEFTSPFQVTVLMLPHSRFDIPYGLLGQMTAVRLGGDAGLGRIVSPFLSQLVADLDDLSGPAGARLVHNAVDLIQTLLTNELDVQRTAASPHWELLERIRDHIDEHLGDPDLSPGTIAQAAFISTRHLHNVFTEQGMTVSAYVRSRRLERCHQDLVDPTQRDTPVAVIGARWGFTDAAHFSRTFKAAYTESPAALRRRVRGDG